MNMRNQSGLTLVELIMTLAIGIILVAGIYQIYVPFVQNNVYVKKDSIIQEHMARANHFLEKDIRMAGYNLPGNGISPDLTVEDDHMIRIFISENNTRTTLLENESAGSYELLVDDDQGVEVGQWICLNNGGTTKYYPISYVGLSTGGEDSIALAELLAEGWNFSETEVYFARCYTYSLQDTENGTSLIRSTHDASYTISSEIETMTIVPKDASGNPLTMNFALARSVSVQLTRQLVGKNISKNFTSTIEASIRNYL